MYVPPLHQSTAIHIQRYARRRLHNAFLYSLPSGFVHLVSDFGGVQNILQSWDLLLVGEFKHIKIYVLLI